MEGECCIQILISGCSRSTLLQLSQDQEAFFKDYTAAWVKLQENGCEGLRDTL